ncbi:MAG: type II toxin-antitoxin system RelE/ParE family toxin, partial [Stellaceae bacterium]
MAQFEIRWTRSALDELDAIGAYIEQFNPSAAQAVADTVIILR